MIKREKILITVKTYPTLSKKYGELVCTAGVKEDGSWIRIYPIPFRRFNDYLQFSKYTWIELQLTKNTDDPRPESFRSIGWDIKILEKIDTKNNWEKRKEIILGNKIYNNLAVLIDKAKNFELSLAVFRPAEICNFIWEEVEREWDMKILKKILFDLKQPELFNPEEIKKDFKIMPKLPYRFYYVFKDIEGKTSKLMIEDWEVGQLFLNCKKRYNDEKKALEKVKQKYFKEFVSERDLYFLLGTTRQYHAWAKNPFVIIGTFHPPKVTQKSFNFDTIL